MNQEDRSFVVIVLGSLASVVAYYAHTMSGPEAALIPIGIAVLLALVVWNNLLRINYIVATIIVAAVEIGGSLVLLDLLFRVSLL